MSVRLDRYPRLYHKVAMPRYKLDYCEVVEFEAQTAGEVVPFIAMDHMMGGESESKFIRRLAIEMCEWNGKNYCYSNRHKLAKSMMKNGLLECVD